MSEHTFLFELGVEELPPKYVILYKKILNNNDQEADKIKNTFFLSLDRVHPVDISFVRYLNENLITNKIGRENKDVVEIFCTPRRLAFKLKLASDKQNFEAFDEKRTGPKVKSIEDKPAVGFARGCKVDPKELQIGEDGRVFCMVRKEPKPVKELLPGIIKTTFEQFNKTVGMRFMHWGEGSELFIRPVKWLTCMFNSEVIEMNWYGLNASNTTRGHRFHSGETVEIPHAKDYENILREKHKVEACFDIRQKNIKKGISQEVEKIKGIVEFDQELLDEVTAINEWPHAILCDFDESFLSVPQEALIESMKSHQKSFPVLDKAGKMKPHFITVSNIKADDYSSIKHGNEKVMGARLADAKFFYETDLKRSLDEMNEKCKTVTFQKKLGTQWDKTRRVILLAEFIAGKVGADVSKVKRAAELANADLNSSMVFEFTELQGIMGKYYALAAGEDALVSDAIEQRYWPRFSDDNLPVTREAQSLAIADRIDSLVGIFGIGLKPTGSKDPFSLRRAAIGVVRIIRENNLDVSLGELLDFSKTAYADGLIAGDTVDEIKTFILKRLEDLYQNEHPDEAKTINILRAILAAEDDRLHDVDVRFNALRSFKDKDEMKTLAEMNKRCKNILRKAKEDGASFDEFNQAIAECEQETALYDSCLDVANSLNSGRDYESQLAELTRLAAPLTDFFDNVMVMADDDKIKNNRLALLNKISVLFQRVADVSHL